MAQPEAVVHGVLAAVEHVKEGFAIAGVEGVGRMVGSQADLPQAWLEFAHVGALAVASGDVPMTPELHEASKVILGL